MQYEIEVKALLGSQEKVDALLDALQKSDKHFVQFDAQKQLNHYFKGGSIQKIIAQLGTFFSSQQRRILEAIATDATSFSVRTREKNDITFLVVKGALDSASADHSHRRIEFEEQIDLPIEELDALLLKAGFELEAKWSADRRMFRYRDLTVDVMFSPGYGYVVEFEKVIDDESAIESTRENVLHTMAGFGIEELDPDRLERMFAYYNAHWPEYYGTNKVFTVL